MPRGDRTGPEGMGPMTGRAAGHCAGTDRPGFTNWWGPGRGFRRGFGRGFGRGGGRFGRRNRARNRAYADPAWDVPPAAPQPSREQETSWLKARAADLQEALNQINERLNDLEQE
jgi:hypothetical protein